MNDNANRRHGQEPNCRRESSSQPRVFVHPCGPLQLMENDVQLLSKDPS